MYGIASFIEDESGAGTVEFVLLGGAVTAVVIAGLIIFAAGGDGEEGLNAVANEQSGLIATTDQRKDPVIDAINAGIAAETSHD